MSDFSPALVWRSFRAAFYRQIMAYFTTPLAYVFVAVFLLALGLFTWEAARFFDAARADLAPFFLWHPWLYMIFMPALAMGLWSDEAAQGTGDLVFSLPVSLMGMVLGKLAAAWAVAGVMLVFTLPMWATVSYLGSPDHATIGLCYLVSFLMAGAYIALGSACSAMSRNQVVAFVLGVVVAFFFTAAGWPIVLSGVHETFGASAADMVASLSFLTQFDAAKQGILELRAVVYFLSVVLLGCGLSGLWAAKARER